jgi:uncharacterized protein YcfJ
MSSRSKFVASAVLVALGTVGVAGAAFADPPQWSKARDRYERDSNRESDYARVIDVEPIVRRVRVTTPDRECWNETQEIYPSRPSSAAGSAILGTLIGGVIGHQIGHGHRDGRVATVGGAIVGAAIGNQIGAQRDARNGQVIPVERTVERCNVVYRDDYEERVDGYRVTYVYNGREYSTRMPYDPGRRIRVDVNVRPEYDRRY